jgi:hypothetical protein
MPVTPLSVLAQVAPGAATHPIVAACGDAAEASSLCRSIYRATGNAVLAQLSDTILVKAPAPAARPSDQRQASAG